MQVRFTKGPSAKKSLEIFHHICPVIAINNKQLTRLIQQPNEAGLDCQERESHTHDFLLRKPLFAGTLR